MLRNATKTFIFSTFPVENIISLELLALFAAEQREMSAQKP